MVDCDATVHIVHEKFKLTDFDKNLNHNEHIIELADGSKSCGIIEGKETALFTLIDRAGVKHNVKLCDALYIHTFNQNIFSVQAAVKKNVTISFKRDSAVLTTSNGDVFDICKQCKLYFLNRADSIQSLTLEEWNNVLGHVNKADLLKLENVVNGMKFSSKQDFD